MREEKTENTSSDWSVSKDLKFSLENLLSTREAAMPAPSNKQGTREDHT